MSMIIPNVEELVSADHVYRKLLKIVDWKELSKPLGALSQREFSGEVFLQFWIVRTDA